jgi:hypothetical protein
MKHVVEIPQKGSSGAFPSGAFALPDSDVVQDGPLPASAETLQTPLIRPPSR